MSAMRPADSGGPRLPSFLVIGADPPDVGWLLRSFEAHPAVHAMVSDAGYFTSAKRVRALGRDWYAAQFNPAPGEEVVGEICLKYAQLDSQPNVVARRVKRVLPDVRLVVIVRNPVERAFMQWTEMKHAGQTVGERMLDRLQAVEPERDPEGLVTAGWYGARLAPFRRLFGDQLLVVLHDDLVEDPASTFQTILRHIGADANVAPAALDPGSACPTPLPAFEVDEEAAVADFFRHDLRRFETVLGRELPPWIRPSTKLTLKWSLPAEWDALAECTDEILRSVDDQLYARSTPCELFTVADLLRHMLERLRNGIEDIAETPPVWSVDIVDDPGGAFREVAEVFAVLIADDSLLSGTVTTDNGPLPARFFAYGLFAHHAAYTWDLAVATDQFAELPTEALRAAERFVEPLLKSIERRPETIDAAVCPPDDATPTERFVASLGRDPGAWRPRQDA